MLARATSNDERLAVRRAILGACIEAMAHVDDSCGELGDHFREHEREYLAQVLGYLDQPDVMRDLLDLVIWEDYGFFHHVHDFLSKLHERAADLAVRELARSITELRGAKLHYQCARARRLRELVLESVKERPDRGGRRTG